MIFRARIHQINDTDSTAVLLFLLFLITSNQIFIIFVVLRRSVLRVCGAHFRVIAPAGNTAPFEEMLLRWRAAGNSVFYLTGPRLEP